MSDISPENPPLLALVRDLMFAGKIRATAQAENVPIKMLRDPAALEREAGLHLIVDLNLDGAIPAAEAWKQRTGGAVVGFVAHVDAAAIAQARAVGIDQILTRGQFVQVLPDLLRPSR